MEYNALILGTVTISNSGVLLSLAALSGCCAFLGLQRRRKKDLFPAAAVLLPGLLLSLPLSRLIHWYSNTSQYSSFLTALTDYSSGGFVVLGVFASFLLSALLMRSLGVVKNLPALLDDLACAGALSAAVGKLACLYSPVCRSKFTLQSEGFHRLPFMVSSTLSNGTVEWRIATFCLQSIAYFLIFLVALLFLSRNKKSGESFALTLSLMSAVHVVLDSTRYDAAYLRSNGFVSITQICCAVTLLTVMLIFSIRSVKRYGLHKRHILYWVLWAAFAGVGGYCEYYVQRHGDSFLTTYSLMEGCFLSAFVINCLLSRSLPERSSKKEEADPAPVKVKQDDPIEETETAAEKPAANEESTAEESPVLQPIPEEMPSEKSEAVEEPPPITEEENKPEAELPAPENRPLIPESPAEETTVPKAESAVPVRSAPVPKAPKEKTSAGELLFTLKEDELPARLRGEVRPDGERFISFGDEEE